MGLLVIYLVLGCVFAGFVYGVVSEEGKKNYNIISFLFLTACWLPTLLTVLGALLGMLMKEDTEEDKNGEQETPAPKDV